MLTIHETKIRSGHLTYTNNCKGQAKISMNNGANFINVVGCKFDNCSKVSRLDEAGDT